jgi:hypothetical protein
VSTAELEAELARQSKLVEEGLLAARKKVLQQPQEPAAAREATSSSNGASSSGGAAEQQRAAEAPSSHDSSSSGGGAAAASSTPAAAAASPGYTVVSNTAAGAPMGVAWPQSQGGGSGREEAAAPKAVSPASLAGVLEGREALQQYKQQQEVRQ